MAFFNIFGTKIKVVKKDLSQAGFLGLYYNDKKKIEITTGLDKQTELETIIHEFVHAVFDRLSYRQAINIQLEELICDQLAKSLCENFTIRMKNE